MNREMLLGTLALALLIAVAPASAGEPAGHTLDASDMSGKSDEEHVDEEHGDEGHGDEDHGDEDHGGDDHGGGHSSRYSDDYIPLQLEAVPKRPKPILELGEPYLGTGTLKPGFRLPTGAVWQPALLAFGTFRTAIQTFEPDAGLGFSGGRSRVTEWTNRLDLFVNLQLSGSERLVVGIRALDEDGRFTGYFFEHPDDRLEGDFQDAFSADVETLFFEGDFGEIFPNLDRDDFGSTDVGFSVGRQPMLVQEGMLIDDTIDGLGLTRNTLQPKNTSNFRLTFFYGWDNVNVSNAERRSANLYALLTSADFRKSTVDVDLAYVQEHGGGGDFFAGGVSAVQRIGKTNSSLRILGSTAIDRVTSASTDGLLLFSELSWVPHYTEDMIYLTTFWAIDEYSPAARGVGPASSGPLGRAGINFAAVGLGSFGAPLSARAREVAGGAIGYQKFLAHGRKQLLLEAGFRVGTASDVEDALAATARYQAAVGQHLVVVADGFVGYREASDATPYGGRLELVVKF